MHEKNETMHGLKKNMLVKNKNMLALKKYMRAFFELLEAIITLTIDGAYLKQKILTSIWYGFIVCGAKVYFISKYK